MPAENAVNGRTSACSAVGALACAGIAYQRQRALLGRGAVGAHVALGVAGVAAAGLVIHAVVVGAAGSAGLVVHALPIGVAHRALAALAVGGAVLLVAGERLGIADQVALAVGGAFAVLSLGQARRRCIAGAAVGWRQREGDGDEGEGALHGGPLQRQSSRARRVASNSPGPDPR